MLKKIVLLMMAVLVSVCLPAGVALAQDTTVEINSGDTIVLNEGESIAATSTSGIPVAVRNLPDLNAPTNGLAAFTFDLSWNKDVIKVDSVIQSMNSQAMGWFFIMGTLDNTNDQARISGFTTNFATTDITLFHLGITAVGNTGDSTSISVTITSLYDKENAVIPATPVRALVKIGTITQPPLVSLAAVSLSPDNLSIKQGTKQQFIATGTFDDTTTADITSMVTWISSDETVATIQTTGEVSPGLASGLELGKTTITAVLGTVSDTAELTVTETKSKVITTPPPEETTPPAPEEKEKVPPPEEKEKTTPIPEEEQSATPAPSEEEKQDSPPPSSTETLPPPFAPVTLLQSLNWWLVGGIIVGLVLLGFIIFFWVRRRD